MFGPDELAVGLVIEGLQFITHVSNDLLGIDNTARIDNTIGNTGEYVESVVRREGVEVCFESDIVLFVPIAKVHDEQTGRTISLE